MGRAQRVLMIRKWKIHGLIAWKNSQDLFSFNLSWNGCIPTKHCGVNHFLELTQDYIPLESPAVSPQNIYYLSHDLQSPLWAGSLNNYLSSLLHWIIISLAYLLLYFFCIPQSIYPKIYSQKHLSEQI